MAYNAIVRQQGAKVLSVLLQVLSPELCKSMLKRMVLECPFPPIIAWGLRYFKNLAVKSWTAGESKVSEAISPPQLVKLAMGVIKHDLNASQNKSTISIERLDVFHVAANIITLALSRKPKGLPSVSTTTKKELKGIFQRANDECKTIANEAEEELKEFQKLDSKTMHSKEEQMERALRKRSVDVAANKLMILRITLERNLSLL
mmetsp:Transcript_8508/g.12747  ORF Transcript_8508/g.12747 Transcript_8508/m.12747 type:complete len:204 (-) Transcript_8508:132-743(-)